MTDLPRIDAVKAENGHRLRVKWKDGRSETVDLTGVVQAFAPFAPLRDPALFRKVSAVGRGTGIAWANGLDYSAESLNEVAEAQRAMSGAEFKRWQKQMALSNAEVATIFGVAKSTVKNYHARRLLPVAVRIACRKIARQPELFFGLYRPRRAGRPAADRAKTGL
jgi:DNA-binding transcriptional regulator YiaG